VVDLLHAERVITPLGSAEHSLRSASPPARRMQRAATAGAGVAENGLPGPLGDPANLARSSAKREKIVMRKIEAMKAAAVEEHLQRFHTPDGACLHCRQPANRYHPVGPITITLSAPDDGNIWAHEFCNWDCVAAWFAEQAGGDFVKVQQ
jgi:hypothetical protein